MYEQLLSYLNALEGVAQDPRYHPEGDALFHSLQVFDVALEADAHPPLLAAALLHDVGKAYGSRGHAQAGADMLYGLVPPHTGWLVSHHLDLLREPKLTRARWAGTPQGIDLSRLRRFDTAGRNPFATVRSADEALSITLEALDGVAQEDGQ